MTTRDPVFCIVAQNAYGVLADENTNHCGGVEIQAVTMARWLTNSGYDVKMITWDEGYDDGTKIDNIQVFKLCKRTDGVPGIRFLVPRWTSLIRALERTNADIVLYKSGDRTLGQIVQWAKIRGKKVCYQMSDEYSCYRSMPHLTSMRERFLFRFGIRNCDKIFAQTLEQRERIKREWGLASVRLPNCCSGLKLDIDLRSKMHLSPQRVLWVGRFHPVKRLEWLLDIAQALPHLEFDVVGDANTETSYSREMKLRSESIPNVTLHGRTLHTDMGPFYQRSMILCLTSTSEGFPNVYMEAWSVGVPVVATYDPDGTIEKQGLGRVANSVSSLAAAIQSLLDPESWHQAASAATTYFRSHHHVDATMPQYLREFERMK